VTKQEWQGLPLPRRYWSIAAIWLAMTVAVLDGSIANVALPAIARDIHALPAEAIWVVNAYQLAIVVALLPSAALGERFGYARIFRSGLALFVAASLFCVLSRSLPQLALARGLQGFGAAGIMSLNGAMVRLTVPHRKLGRMIGLNAVVIAVGAATGPTIASLVLALGTWQWLFAINLPIGIASIAAGWGSLPEGGRVHSPFDGRSALLNILCFGLIVIGADTASRTGDVAGGALLLAGGVIAAILLVRRSFRQSRPLVPLDLLRAKLFRLSVLTSIASFTAQALAYVALPFYFEGALHQSQVRTGFLMTPWPVTVGIAAALAGRLADKYPAGVLGSLGLAAFLAGLLALALLPAQATFLDIGWRMALCGLGFGFFQAPNNRTLLASAPLHRSGAAAGMLATARVTGQTIGATLTAIIFTFWPEGQAHPLFAAAGFSLAAILVSLMRLDLKPHPVQAEG
jgi:DHA2 family multidrug resistance protein-like MFS transporter